jgi:hypothetical protein
VIPVCNGCKGQLQQLTPAPVVKLKVTGPPEYGTKAEVGDREAVHWDVLSKMLRVFVWPGSTYGTPSTYIFV